MSYYVLSIRLHWLHSFNLYYNAMNRVSVSLSPLQMGKLGQTRLSNLVSGGDKLAPELTTLNYYFCSLYYLWEKAVCRGRSCWAAGKSRLPFSGTLLETKKVLCAPMAGHCLPLHSPGNTGRWVKHTRLGWWNHQGSKWDVNKLWDWINYIRILFKKEPMKGCRSEFNPTKLS